MGTGVSFPGDKRPEGEAEHLPPSNAELKNTCSYASTPQYVLMAWCLLKHKMRLSSVVLCQTQGQLYLYLACYF
jgi:hypothetical protein